MPTERVTVSPDEDLLTEMRREAQAQDRPLTSLSSAYWREGLERDPVRAKRKTKRGARR